MKVTKEMREAEPFRWCVHCGADCEEYEPEHAADCPSVTGLWVVGEEQCGDKCPSCSTLTRIPCCMGCGTELPPGAHYVLREVDPGDPSDPGLGGASVAEMVCVGCAALGVEA